MSKELISKAARNEFREVLTGYVLREIDMLFEAGGITPRRGYDPQVAGQRRSRIECYYANLDFASAADVKRLLTVYEEVMENLQQVAERNPESQNVTMNALLRRMERDGFRYRDGRFVASSVLLIVTTLAGLVVLIGTLPNLSAVGNTAK